MYVINICRRPKKIGLKKHLDFVQSRDGQAHSHVAHSHVELTKNNELTEQGWCLETSEIPVWGGVSVRVSVRTR
jgi:hypothetical protein